MKMSYSMVLLGFYASLATRACTPKVKSTDERQVLRAQLAEDRARPPVTFPSPANLPSVQTPAPGGDQTGEPGASQTPSSGPAQILTVNPPAEKAILLGKNLEVQIRFSQAVKWIGEPKIKVTTSEGDLELKATGGLGTDLLTFSAQILSGKDATLLKAVGPISIGDGALDKVDGGAAELGFPELDLAGYTLVRDQTSPLSVELPDSATYTDSFEFSVNFEGPVTLRGFPHIEVIVNTQSPIGLTRAKRAFASRVDGSKVTFRYNVKQDDADTNDGVTFDKTIRPELPLDTLEAILGSNGNPVKSDLSAISWPSRVIKVAPLLPNAPLYAHFKAQAGDFFAAAAGDQSSCLSAQVTTWSNGEKMGCWQPQAQSTPYLQLQGTDEVEKPTLVAVPQAPLRLPFVRFLPNGTRPGLVFPTSSSPLFTQNSPRFVALAFHIQSEINGQPLIWLDENQGVFLNPISSEVLLKSGVKEKTASTPLASGKVVLMGISDTGTDTSLLIWGPNDSSAQTLTLQPAAGSGPGNVFNYSFENLRIAGRKGINFPAFEGGISEILMYGSLIETEQRTVLCYLATRHNGFSGGC